MNLYILKDREPVLEKDREEWQIWKNEHQKECQVACSHIYGATVRTRFVGCDPLGAGYLFSISVTGKTKVESVRARTWDDAVKFHQWRCDDIAAEHEKGVLKNVRKTHRSTL